MMMDVLLLCTRGVPKGINREDEVRKGAERRLCRSLHTRAELGLILSFLKLFSELGVMIIKSNKNDELFEIRKSSEFFIYQRE